MKEGYEEYSELESEELDSREVAYMNELSLCEELSELGGVRVTFCCGTSSSSLSSSTQYSGLTKASSRRGSMANSTI